MSAERDTYEELLARLGDGGEVDWERARSERTDPDERRLVDTLSDVARIVEFNRQAQREGAAATLEGAGRGWGPFLLLESLGSGTSGEVWRAWDTRLERELAVKMLRPEAERAADPAALIAEGRALAQLRHPNVVGVLGIESHDGRHGLLMEMLHGVTLAHEIGRRGALPGPEAMALARDLFSALSAVHAAGVLHRDVKPANVVRDASGRWVLADFGLGLRRGHAGESPVRASGTPMFMPPECLDGAPPGERSDVYAAGATIWWALTGRAPFAATRFDELREQARRGPDVSLLERGDVPAALRDALASALSPAPALPPAGAATLLAALDAGRGTARRGATLRALVLAVALAGTAALAWFGWRATHRPPAAASPSASVADASLPYAVTASLVGFTPAGERALVTGDRVRPGDRLGVEFHSTRPMWVYVLDGDERGETYLLFPQPLFDQRNPIAPGRDVRLPGAMRGRPSAWTVTSRGGREHVLLVASPQPVPELEQALVTLAAPSPGRPVDYARVGTRQLELLRGVGGVSPLDAPVTRRPASLFEHYRALAGREEDVRGTWVRQVTLENPGR